MKISHIPEGILRAYQDKEVPEKEIERIRQHLESCPACQDILADLRARSQQVDRHLAELDSKHPAAMPQLSKVYSHFENYRTQKEVKSMFQKFFAPRYRLAWIGLSLVLILSVSMVFPSVRAIANSFLGLFRVQSITVVQVDPGNLPDQLRSSASLETLFAEDVQAEMIGETVTVNSAAEASGQVGYPVRLPTTGGTPHIEVMPGAKMSITVDLEKARMILQEIGRSDIQLPEELDGAQVTVEIPKVVTASFGECAPAQDVASFGYDPTDPDDLSSFDRCTAFTQMQTPTVNAPEGLDINRIGAAFLELLGMSPEDAAHFSENIDWTTTLVIPLPNYIGATFQDMAVDDVMGTLILNEAEGQSSRYLLLWVKDGMVYGLSGPGNATAAARVAGTLK